MQTMLKATGALILLMIAVHAYILAQTGHLDPCEAAYYKLESETLNDFKNKRRDLAADETQQPLYDQITRRDILSCYKIVLF